MLKLPLALGSPLVFCATVGCAERARHTLTLSGSTSVQPLAEHWAEAYQAEHPGLTIAVQGGGSTAGVQAAVSGAAQIGMSSRTSTSRESREVHAIRVARDGIALVVHPKNPIVDLSLTAVRGIYSGRAARWPPPHGPVATITLITREEGSGTRAAFEHLVMGGEPISASALVQDSTGAVRQMVGSDPAAIGYISIGLVDASVKALRLDGVAASESDIDRGVYPLVRPFLFLVRGQPEPDVEAFMAWVSGPRGREVARSEGLLPASEERPDARP